MTVSALVVFAAVTLVTAATATAAPAIARDRAFATTATKKLVGTAPRPVSVHEVNRFATHDASVVLALNLGLDIRNSAELDDVIRAASTPGSPDYGHYLTEAEYRSRYAPTDAAVQSVRAWAAAQGMRVTGVSADNALVSVDATTAVAERAFGVTIGEYDDAGRTFYANDVAPSVPAASPVRWVTGLENYTTYRAFSIEPNTISGAFEPSDFQSAYNTGGATTTQGIGFTLWGAPMVQSDLDGFADATETDGDRHRRTGRRRHRLHRVRHVGLRRRTAEHRHRCAGGDRARRRVGARHRSRRAHEVLAREHQRRWSSERDGSGERAERRRERLDPRHRVEQLGSRERLRRPWDPNMDVSFQHGAAVGKTFYFSSGDNADAELSGDEPVRRVGRRDEPHARRERSDYVSEVDVGGLGHGLLARTSRARRGRWVSGARDVHRARRARCRRRRRSADRRVRLRRRGLPVQVGGTSLAAPLWAGMTAVWNQANVNASKPLVGFAAPLFYALGNNPSVYDSVFHDVTTGSAGGNDAGTGLGPGDRMGIAEPRAT